MSVDWHDVERLMERVDKLEAKAKPAAAAPKATATVSATPAATASDATMTALPVGS